MRLANPQRRFVNLFNQYQKVETTVGKTLVAGFSNILVMPTFNVIVDSFVLLQASLILQKGAVAGNTNIKWFKDSGTGAITWLGNLLTSGFVQPPGFNINLQDANSNVRVDGSWWIRATSSGTMSLVMQGQSAGSNVTITAGQAIWEMYLFL